MIAFNLSDSTNKSAIAIIGMAGRFPGAKNVTEFWQNLRNGVESISFLSDEELRSVGVETSLLNDTNYVKAAPVLPDVENFDASFFGYSARESTIIDPQQRIFLECAWEALENAGYKTTDDFSIGIYGGSGISTYLLNNINNKEFNAGRLWDSVQYIPVAIGNGTDFLTTRVAYKLNLKGPAVNVQTACSTSLVAVHTACQSLLNGECDIALAGAVSVLVPQKIGYLYQEGLMLSPDGHCRAFDAEGKGTIFGDGVGIVVLKMLTEALADGDYIHAVIKGSAINNDGSFKVSFTAPSVDGQAAVITEAQEVADIDPETITYIEAHGTGTPLGDPIEIAALTQAFRANTEKKGYCAIGSVKTNIGHIVSAAGIAGLIKTVLALKHQQIPPSLHFQKPNPEIDFENSPFYVNTKLTEWERNDSPRRAGVSSFGFGGTNAHVVLEEWEQPPLTPPNQGKEKQQLLLLSAKTPSALDNVTINLANHLKQHPEVNLADVAYTLTVGRTAFNYRRIAVVADGKEAVNTLNNLAPKQVLTNSGDVKSRSVVFMFSGQGSQYVNMAKELYKTEVYFQEQVDRCCELLKSHLDFDLRDILYPHEDQIEIATEKLTQTAITQPALFIIEYALAQLWMHWGIKPVAMIGHSVGEYVAATLAGIFSLEDALSLVTIRGQLMQSMPSGSMLAVPLPEDEVQPLLEETSLQIAVINSPSNCVVSGTTLAIEAFAKQLEEKGIEGRLLHTSHAFHSQMMEDILEPFTEKVKQIRLNAPTIPFVSNVTGTWITVEEATNPSYYAQHLRQAVRFADGVKQFFDNPDQILLEVGPGRTLSTLAKRHPDKPKEQISLTSVRHPQDEYSDVSFILNNLGQMWLAGLEVNWSVFYGERENYRVPLPTYPFERKRYWIEPSKQSTEPQRDKEKKPDIADWFYVPTWKQSIKVANSQQLTSSQSPILVFVDECGLSSQLVAKLESQKIEVIQVAIGEKFNQLDSHLYSINPSESQDYQALIQELVRIKKTPQAVLHLWNVTANSQVSFTIESVEKQQNLGFYSLIYLAQALGEKNVTDEMKMLVISNHLQNVNGEEILCPEKATIIGPVRVISQEYPHIHCTSVDVVLPPGGSNSEQKLIAQLLSEIPKKSADNIIAYRGNHRWIQTFEAAQLPSSSQTPQFKAKGIYLITGGTGGIGLVLATNLAKTVQAKLILTGRTALPEREQWPQWLAEHDAADSTSDKIRKVQELEALGAEVLVVKADVANLQQMERAIATAQNHFGKINGVIHAAGLPGGGIIQMKTREITDQVLAPKVQGTVVIDTIFKNSQLDFVILCSSITSIIGNFGQVDYTAANAFLDAYAQYQTAQDRLTTSINWDTWQEVGMAVNTVDLRKNKSSDIINFDLAILPQEGIEVFNRISQSGLSQVAVSTYEFLPRIKEILLVVESNDSAESSNLTTGHNQVSQSPQSQIDQIITQVWQEMLGIDKIGMHDNFFDLGGDSLVAIQLIAKLNKKLNVKLSLNSLLNAATIEGLAELVSPSSPALQKELPSCLIKFHSGSDLKKPLFLVHPVGGTAFVFRDLANHLDPEQPVYGIQVPEVDSKPRTFNTIEEMATHYVDAVRTIQPKGPYYIGGMSLGGIIAYEMAQQLTKEGEKIELLTLFDTPISGELPTHINSDLEIMAYWLDMDKKSDEGISLKILQNLEPNEQLRYFWERSRIAKSMVPQGDLTMFRNFLDLFISLMRLGNNYVPTTYQGKVIFFIAEDDDGFTPYHPEKDWLELAEIVTEEVPGNHMTMMYPPHVEVFAQKLRYYLASPY